MDKSFRQMIRVNINKYSYTSTNNPAIFSDGSFTEIGVASCFYFITMLWVCQIGYAKSVSQAKRLTILVDLKWLALDYQFNFLNFTVAALNVYKKYALI